MKHSWVRITGAVCVGFLIILTLLAAGYRILDLRFLQQKSTVAAAAAAVGATTGYQAEAAATPLANAQRERIVDAALIVFGGFGAATLLAFCIELAYEGRLTVEARWGTLGGGNKGYSISPATALFLLLLAYLLTFVGFGYLERQPAAQTQQMDKTKP